MLSLFATAVVVDAGLFAVVVVDAAVVVAAASVELLALARVVASGTRAANVVDCTCWCRAAADLAASRSPAATCEAKVVVAKALAAAAAGPNDVVCGNSVVVASVVVVVVVVGVVVVGVGAAAAVVVVVGAAGAGGAANWPAAWDQLGSCTCCCAGLASDRPPNEWSVA